MEGKARAEQERKKREPLGRAAILSQDPHGKPTRSKKSPAPRFHAFRKSVRQDLYETCSWFVAAFRTASEKLRSGDLTASFPPGSFPRPCPSFLSTSDFSPDRQFGCASHFSGHLYHPEITP